MTEGQIREQAMRFEAARTESRAAQEALRLAARRTAASKVGMGAGLAAGVLIGRSWRCQGNGKSNARLFNRLRALAPLLIWMTR